MLLTKNGSAKGINVATSSINGDGASLNGSTKVYLESIDEVQIRVWHKSGGSLNLLASGSIRLIISKVGLA